MGKDSAGPGAVRGFEHPGAFWAGTATSSIGVLRRLPPAAVAAAYAAYAPDVCLTDVYLTRVRTRGRALTFPALAPEPVAEPL